MIDALFERGVIGATQGITKKVLEAAGYTVKVTTFSEWGIVYAALTKGDVQVLASQTDYAAHDFWDKNKNRLEKISPVSHGLYQALAVPKYVPIDSIEELNANADKFGGKIVGIEAGSGLMRDAAAAVSPYDLKLNLVEGSTTAMTAALKSGTDRKEWIVTAIWEPSWMMQKFDVKFLRDPKGVFPPARKATTGSATRASRKRTRTPVNHLQRVRAAICDYRDQRRGQGRQDHGRRGRRWTAANADLIKRWTNIKKD